MTEFRALPMATVCRWRTTLSPSSYTGNSTGGVTATVLRSCRWRRRLLTLWARVSCARKRVVELFHHYQRANVQRWIRWTVCWCGKMAYSLPMRRRWLCFAFNFLINDTELKLLCLPKCPPSSPYETFVDGALECRTSASSTHPSGKRAELTCSENSVLCILKAQEMKIVVSLEFAKLKLTWFLAGWRIRFCTDI